MKIRIKQLLILLFVLLSLTTPALAATWYVDCEASASGADGTLAHPWTNTSAIVWTNKVVAGDIIVLRGSPSAGCTYSGLSTGSSGTTANPILIVRSEESGHNGEVRVQPPIRINNPNITIDGKDRYKLKIDCVSSQIGVSVNSSGDNFVIRNASLIGHQVGSDSGSISSYARNLTIQSSYFESSCSQDILWYFPGNVPRNSDGSGTASLIIENSIFRDNFSKDSIHRDLVNIDGNGGFNMRVRGNIIMNMGDGFLLQNSSMLGNVEFSYNVVSNVARAVAAGSGNAGASSSVAYNNVFYATSTVYDLGDAVATVSIPGTVFRNNIYGRGTTFLKDTNSGGKASITGLNFKGTATYNYGNSSQTRPLGNDGVGFTLDDGFNVNSGSSVENAGGAYRDHSKDILGNAQSGLPDLGAYEIQSGTDGAVPAAPSGLTVQPFP